MNVNKMIRNDIIFVIGTIVFALLSFTTIFLLFHSYQVHEIHSDKEHYEAIVDAWRKGQDYVCVENFCGRHGFNLVECIPVPEEEEIKRIEELLQEDPIKTDIQLLSVALATIILGIILGVVLCREFKDENVCVKTVKDSSFYIYYHNTLFSL